MPSLNKRPPRASKEWKDFKKYMKVQHNFSLNKFAFQTGTGPRGYGQAFVRTEDQNETHVGFQHMEISEAWKFYQEEIHDLKA